MSKSQFQTYYLSFPSGIEETVPRMLKKFSKNTKIQKLLDGGVVFTSSQKTQSFSQIPFANNSFFVLDQFRLEQTKDSTLEKILPRLITWLSKNKVFIPRLPGKTFRIIASYQNTLTKIPAKEHKRLENLLSKKSGAKVDRFNPQHEFWILERSEGITFFMRRLSHNPKQKKIIQKWELSP